MGNALRTIINPVGALFGLPDPILDAVLPEKQQAATQPAKKSLARSAQSSLSNTLRIDDEGVQR